jgi:hypothetical protein
VGPSLAVGDPWRAERQESNGDRQQANPCGRPNGSAGGRNPWRRPGGAPIHPSRLAAAVGGRATKATTGGERTPRGAPDSGREEGSEGENPRSVSGMKQGRQGLGKKKALRG